MFHYIPYAKASTCLPCGSNRQTQTPASPSPSPVLLDFKRGDVNGDGVTDNVYLTGNQRFGGQSPFYDNITITIQDGRTGTNYRIIPRENAGYMPSLLLADFTGDRIPEIFINIDSGGSGGFSYNYLYSFLNNQPRTLYDNESFNNQYQYKVTYQDNYKVEVISQTLNKRYSIDISDRDAEYLAQLYDETGKLLKPVEGSVLSPNGVYPVDIDRNRIYDLFVFQRIIGLYGADTLGFVETPIIWNGGQFIPLYQLYADFFSNS